MYVNGLCDSDFKEQIYFLKILSVMQVTVLMPIYNAEKYLRDAIDSLLCQTSKDWKLICIDDGSIDSSTK